MKKQVSINAELKQYFCVTGEEEGGGGWDCGLKHANPYRCAMLFSPIKFRKFTVALNSLDGIFFKTSPKLNLIKLITFDNTKWGVT